jgi:hypothetical protein
LAAFRHEHRLRARKVGAGRHGFARFDHQGRAKLDGVAQSGFGLKGKKEVKQAIDPAADEFHIHADIR